jgi:CO dehydrogenase maturation factor
VLARTLARAGFSVLAVDADEQRNLGPALGVEEEVTPLSAQAAYVEEKTGARPGEGAGGLLRLNPDVSDVVERMGVPAPDGVRLLVMGGLRQAGSGCLCPEHALVQAVVGAMRLRRGEVVVMDTHAGVEHFGRALVRGFDHVLVVVDPSANAVRVGVQSARLASEMGIGDVRLVVNRVRRPEDLSRTFGHLAAGEQLLFSRVHVLPEDAAAELADPAVDPLLGENPLAGALSRLSGMLLDPVAPVVATTPAGL